MKYRCYPQKRASTTDEVTVTSTYEDVPNSKDRYQDSYNFHDLYTYVDYDRNAVIKEDGTTVVKVYMKRNTFTLTYTWNKGSSVETITKK